MHAYPADPKRLRDGSGCVSSRPHLADLLDRLRRLAARIDPLGISCFDLGLLSLADELSLPPPYLHARCGAGSVPGYRSKEVDSLEQAHVHRSG